MGVRLRTLAAERISLSLRLAVRSSVTLLVGLDPGGEVRGLVSVHAGLEVGVKPNRCVDLGMLELRLDIFHGLPLAEHQGGIHWSPL